LTEKKNHKKDPEGKIEIVKKEEHPLAAGEKKPSGGNGQEGAAAKEPAPQEKLQAQLEEKTREAKEYYDQWLRLRAEFENFKKRMQKERADHIKFGNEGFLKAIIPIIDNLERAIDHGQSLEGCAPLLDGVKMTHKQFMDALEKFGVKSFLSVGEVFDPERHEALYHEESEKEPNRIIGEVTRGYMFHERLLRPAKVIVAKAKKE
jgi:molecular chaperone GrpE